MEEITYLSKGDNSMQPAFMLADMTMIYPMLAEVIRQYVPMPQSRLNTVHL